MLGIVVERYMENIFVLMENVQANIGMPEIIHMVQRPAGKQAEEAAHGPAVHTDQNGLLFGPGEDFLQSDGLPGLQLSGCFASFNGVVQIALLPAANRFQEQCADFRRRLFPFQDTPVDFV